MTVIQTATGGVAVESLGRTLTHEHLFLNMMRERRGDGLLIDEALITSELRVFADQGGGTIWDLTTAELTPGSTPDSDPTFTGRGPGETRDPANVRAVARVSAATGVRVVLGTGHYRDPYLDPELFDRATVAQLAETLVRDLEVGFADTGIRAGVIGEIGSDRWFVSAREERSFRAAARAAVQTNAPLYTHAARWPVGHAQLDILAEAGVDPSRVIVGHTDTVPEPGFALTLLQRGVNVGFDTINSARQAPVDFAIREIVALVRAGHVERIVLAHDVCVVSHLQAFGGNGFGFVLGGFREQLIAAGVSEAEFDMMTIDNPARILRG